MTASATNPLRRLARWLPEGRELPEEIWRRRHQVIVRIAVGQALALGVFAVVQRADVVVVLGSVLAVLAPVLPALSPRAGRKLQSGAVSASLFVASAVLVFLWHGQTEAHFHFFVMIGVVALYQDWIPFLIGLAIVVLHHGILGTLDPVSVYDHHSAHEHPWRWMFVHAGFVLAASIAHLASWRLNEQQAISDPLTGLATRGRLLEALGTALGRRYPVNLVLVDLDDLTTLVETYGEEVGDEVRRAVAARLLACVRSGDVVARLGEAQFGVVVTAGPVEARTVAERFLASVVDPVVVHDRSFPISAAVGIGSPETLEQPSADALLRSARLAAVWARAQDRTAVAVHTEGMTRLADDRAGLQADLDVALAAGQFVVFYQPILDLRTTRTVKYEALLRWRHPDRGLVSPAEFIPLLEDSGGIVDVGAWVLRTAAEQAVRWSAERGTAVGVTVNLSGLQLADDHIVDVVLDVLRDTGLPPGQLTLEVTESLLMQDLDAVCRRLSLLQEMNLLVAIDDFGTGYSSLAYLRRLPVDIVKLDRSFINDLAVSRSARLLVSSVLELTRSLDLDVIAEGVETDAQAQVLAELRCGYVQGFRYARPLPAAEITAPAALLS